VQKLRFVRAVETWTLVAVTLTGLLLALSQLKTFGTIVFLRVIHDDNRVPKC
jgi:hypothetical protein